MGELLSAHGLRKRFGALTVTDDLSFSLKRGEALGIIGPNGAGKSTLFNLVAGVLAPDAGTILFRGRDISALPPEARCREGIARSYQIPRPFGGLSVFENLLVAAEYGGRLPAPEARERAMDILDSLGLARHADRPAGGLTLLDRKRLELARALATGPEVLLLDEIAGGLSDAECVSLIAQIDAIRARGVSIVWIEHVVHALLAVANRLMVIDFGRKIAEGEPKAVFASPEVQRIYMGIEA